MNLKKLIILLAMIVSLSFPLADAAQAIGKWQKGTVTIKPWQEQYTYIVIDNIKYTVMKDVKVLYVTTKKDATVKETMELSGIGNGDTLLFQAEGNRIYQIEKIRY